jgi:hypothetical protein
MQKKSYLLLSVVLTTGLITSCTYRFYPSACDQPVPGNLVRQAVLDTTLRETSGLLYLEGSIWTFNDSGGEAALYCVDPRKGTVIRKTIIRNATNVDWEDIAVDETHVFIADIGNNFAARDTLVIYRVLKTGVLSGNPVLFHDGMILLTFHEQMARTRSGLSSHDCEALVVSGDSIYLFSKNWVDESTSVYVFPKEPGIYNVNASYTYEVGMLVTGADLFPERHQVSLVGYSHFMPVVISYLYLDDPGRIQCGGKARIYPLRAGRQVEGICYDPSGHLFVSAEKSLQKQMLFRVGRTMR